MCDGFDFGGWSLRAASVRGLTHRYASQPRQDAYALRYSAGRQRLVIAVCDGVGGAPESHRAAEITAGCLADRFVDREDDDDDWTAAFTLASDAVLSAAAEFERIERSVDAARAVMATTATLVVIDGVGAAGTWTVRAASVGDSAVWIADRPGPEAGFGRRSSADGLSTAMGPRPPRRRRCPCAMVRG